MDRTEKRYAGELIPLLAPCPHHYAQELGTGSRALHWWQEVVGRAHGCVWFCLAVRWLLCPDLKALSAWLRGHPDWEDPVLFTSQGLLGTLRKLSGVSQIRGGGETLRDLAECKHPSLRTGLMCRLLSCPTPDL